MKSRLNLVIILLCLVGATLSAISLYNHYGTSKTEYCDLNEVFDCDLVNRSSYARFLGVPVALIGLLGYVLLLALSLIRGRTSAVLRVCASLLGLGFALYLAYIEAYVLAVWCLLCIGSLIAIGGIWLVSSIAFLKRSERISVAA